MNVYRYDIREMTDAVYAAAFAAMSAEKRERVERFRFPEDKKRTVAADMLARRGIAAHCGVAPESVVFAAGENGKPYAVGLSAEFNVSHGGNMVVCAVGDQPVGVDVEPLRPEPLCILNRIARPEEIADALGFVPAAGDKHCPDDPETQAAFFRLWTAKEAVGKRLGTGISDAKALSVDGVTTVVDDGCVLTVSYGEPVFPSRLIREIVPADSKPVEDVIRACLIEYGANHEGTAWCDPDLGRFGEIYRGDERRYWVAESDGRIVGGVGIGPLPGAPGVCELQKMYCLPEVRGTGLAARLLETALWFAAKRYDACYLETCDNMTEAQRFYVRHGFARVTEPIGSTAHFACEYRYILKLK